MEEYIYLITEFILVIYTMRLQYKLWKLEEKHKVYCEYFKREIIHRMLLEKIYEPNEEVNKIIEQYKQEIL